MRHAEVIPAQAQVQGEARRPSKTILEIETVAVLRRMSARIAPALATVRWLALEKGREIVKGQFATKGILEHLHDGCPTKLVAEFHIVAAELPRIVVDKVPVCVHSISRNPIGC